MAALRSARPEHQRRYRPLGPLTWGSGRLRKIHSRRERLAHHFLTLAGFETWCPRIRERKIVRGRRRDVLTPLFPGYLFVAIELRWHAAHYAPGVVRLVLDGSRPARVPDGVIAGLRKREKDGVIELPKQPNNMKKGDRVRVTAGLLTGLKGVYQGQAAYERVAILLQMLGGPRRVELPADIVERET